MINFPLAWLGQVTGIESLIGQSLSLSIILGYLLSPLVWIIGIPWSEATIVGVLTSLAG
jgi:CNT family concentrative nucleoside transporter